MRTLLSSIARNFNKNKTLCVYRTNGLIEHNRFFVYKRDTNYRDVFRPKQTDMKFSFIFTSSNLFQVQVNKI